MKRTVVILALLLFSAALSAQKMTFVAHWIPQAQFAGYYVALQKGFYAGEGLDVDINHVSSTSSKTSLDILTAGGADICSMQLIQALAARSGGVPIVNVLQTSQNSGLMCVSHEPLPRLADISGRRVGRWKSGFSEIADMFCNDYGVEVEWVPFINSINLFVSGAVDATLCYSYSEYLQLVFATGGIPDGNAVRFSQLGYNYPEDALFVTEEFYKAHPTMLDKFLRASRKGWDYARENRDEALDIVVEVMKQNGIACNRTLQRMMLDEVLALQVNATSRKADWSRIDEDLFNSLNDSLIGLGLMDAPVNYKDFIR